MYSTLIWHIENRRGKHTHRHTKNNQFSMLLRNNMSPQIYEVGKGHESRPSRMKVSGEERLYGCCKRLWGQRDVWEIERCQISEY